MPKSSATTPPAILHIAVATPVADGFDYLPGTDIPGSPLPGCRIRVPFGHQKTVGVLIENLTKSSIATSKLKTTLELIDQTPVLTAELLNLAKWASLYYQHPLGEVIHTMLPAALRQGKTASPKATQRWQARTGEQRVANLSRAPRQQLLFQAIASATDGLSENQLNEKFEAWRPIVLQLEKKGLLQKMEEPIISHARRSAPRQGSIQLNAEQQEIVSRINAETDRFQTWLIEGITGSGKTEVYLHLIQQTLERGKQCLVLVPEIGLTPQLLDRFSSCLDVPVLTWHSALTDQQRHQIWYAASIGQADVIIGTRSAAFLPLLRPGLIIIDEEHDNSLKQQDGFRYHARDLAIVRAQQLAIPVVLGSATPSLESLHNAAQQRYRLLQLHQRAGGAQPPRVALLDIHNAKANEAISNSMLEAIASHLEQGSQVLLFLNRRGFAPVLLCGNCSWKSECPRCDAHMTLHRHDQRIRCHHCGHQQIKPQKCPVCSATDLQPIGIGTEQLEQVLQSRFPNRSVLRIDRDTVRRKGTLEKHLATARAGDADILLGTQMLAKGHHFPNVTLVGVLGIDQALFSADFRGPEYMAQLIVQVAGRAGRAERKGEVLIETRQPQHPLLRLLVSEGYPAFAQAALAERKEAGLPPYSYLILVRAEAVSPNTALDFLDQLAKQLNADTPAEVQLLGPMPAPMERRAGRFRAQLLLQSVQRASLHFTTQRLREMAHRLPQQRKVRWSIDVDPMEML
ncbi:MAG: primosomal protein N' [Gammaproteobacteria bacterium]|nr:primosomal protein N' [Gammaproteobacteria bacterium]